MNMIMLTADGAGGNTMMTLVTMVAMFGILWFFIYRPQNKKEKQSQVMRSKLEVGDEILTRGGILGRVVSLKDDTVLIESSGDRTKIRIQRWAIEQNMTADEEKRK